MRFRFHKGDRVEVLSKREVSSGSWCYGVIISGNGHTYNIQYESYASTNGAPIVERVPRKSIRPCPPMEVNESWAAGDFVEVFDSASWKFAMVLKVKDKNLFQIRLLGTSQKVEAPKSCLRLPQSWQDEQWVAIETVSGDNENGRSYQKSMEKDSKMRYTRDDNSPVDSEADFQMSHMVSSKTLKRGSPCNLTHGAGQKLRAIEKDGRLQRMAPDNGMHAATKKRENMETRIRNSDTIGRSLEPNDAERSDCSVGSSGTSNKEEMTDNTYKLALDAYHGVMESLRAFGYISWEQEEMITNLRMKLNISNDEHLMELRKLVSAQ